MWKALIKYGDASAKFRYCLTGVFWDVYLYDDLTCVHRVAFIHRADRALRHAKALGQDRVASNLLGAST